MDNTKQIKNMQNEMHSMIQKVDTKEGLMEIHDSMSNFMNYYNSFYREKMLKLEEEQQKELEQLRKIKELLNM